MGSICGGSTNMPSIQKENLGPLITIKEPDEQPSTAMPIDGEHEEIELQEQENLPHEISIAENY